MKILLINQFAHERKPGSHAFECDCVRVEDGQRLATERAWNLLGGLSFGCFTFCAKKWKEGLSQNLPRNWYGSSSCLSCHFFVHPMPHKPNPVVPVFLAFGSWWLFLGFIITESSEVSEVPGLARRCLDRWFAISAIQSRTSQSTAQWKRKGDGGLKWKTK